MNKKKKLLLNWWLNSGGGSPVDPFQDLVFDFDPELTAAGDVISYTNNGITLTPTASGRRPATTENIIDGKKVFRFALNDNFRGVSADWNFIHQGESTIILLVNTTASSAQRTIFDSADSAALTGRYMRVNTTDFILDTLYNGSGSTVFSNTSKKVIAEGQWELLVIRTSTAAIASLEIDNIEESINPSATGTFSGSTSTTLPHWFIRSGGTSSFVGDLARGFVYNKNISEAQLDAVVAYLKTQFPSAITYHDRPSWSSNGKVVTPETPFVVDAPVSNPDYYMCAGGHYYNGISSFIYRKGNGHNDSIAGVLNMRRFDGSNFLSETLVKAADATLLITNPSPLFRCSNGTWINMYIKMDSSGDSDPRRFYARTSTDADGVGIENATWGTEFEVTSAIYPSPGMIDGYGNYFEEGGYLYKSAFGRTTGSGERNVIIIRAAITDLTTWELVSTPFTASVAFAYEEPSIIRRSDGLYILFLGCEGTLPNGTYTSYSWDLINWSFPRYAFYNTNQVKIAVAPDGTILATQRMSGGSSGAAYSSDKGRTFTNIFSDVSIGLQEGAGVVWQDNINKFVMLYPAETDPFSTTELRAVTFTKS